MKGRTQEVVGKTKKKIRNSSYGLFTGWMPKPSDYVKRVLFVPFVSFNLEKSELFHSCNGGACEERYTQHREVSILVISTSLKFD